MSPATATHHMSPMDPYKAESHDMQQILFIRFMIQTKAV
jgi:hypothetical protein